MAGALRSSSAVGSSRPPSVGFLAALLFAFPTVRNNLPGNPPIGSLNDFLAFFWTEGIVALALVGSCSLVRAPAPREQAAGRARLIRS